MKERNDGPRRILKPYIDEHRSTITVNLTTIMAKRYPVDTRQRSARMLRLMEDYLDTFNGDFKEDHEHYIITITKPSPELHTRMYNAIKSGIALSRSELFRHAILWDIDRENVKKKRQITEDKKNKIIKIPREEKEDLVYKIIGVA